MGRGSGKTRGLSAPKGIAPSGASAGSTNNNSVEKLSNGYEIVYKNGVEKQNGDVKGLKLNSYYYAELMKSGKRVDWMYSESSDKNTFDSKIKEWRTKHK